MTFSEDQELTTIGDTPSTDTIDLETADLHGKCIEIAVGSTGLTFDGEALLQVALQTSVASDAWGDFPGGSPALSGVGLAPGQVLTRLRIPEAFGSATRLRLCYRVTGAAPTGTINATLAAVPANRFGYQPSGFAIL